MSTLQFGLSLHVISLLLVPHFLCLIYHLSNTGKDTDKNTVVKVHCRMKIDDYHTMYIYLSMILNCTVLLFKIQLYINFSVCHEIITIFSVSSFLLKVTVTGTTNNNCVIQGYLCDVILLKNVILLQP